MLLNTILDGNILCVTVLDHLVRNPLIHLLLNLQ